MPTATKRKKSKKDNTSLVTQRVRPVKQGRNTFLPIPSQMLKLLNFKPGKQLFCTFVDGVLQLSVDAPVMVISVMDRPEEKFEAQRD